MKKSFSITNTSVKKRFTEETLKRLYPNPTPSNKSTAANTMENMHKKINPGNNIDKFFEKAVTYYYNINKRYTNQETDIYDWYVNLTEEEKEKKGILWEKGNNNLYSELIDFLSEEKILKRLYELFSNICGYKTYETRPIHDYWVNLKIQEKYLKGLNKLNDSELYILLDENAKKKKAENLSKQNEYEQDKKKEEELLRKKNKSNFNDINKEEADKIFEKLAKPKDKWKTGKVMLGLKKKFNYDNIISKMIKQEFINNKEFRYPEEYALYDNDQERKTLFKNSIEKMINKGENIEKIKEMIQKAKFSDDELKKTQFFILDKIHKENKTLERFLKKNCILYFKKMQERFIEEKAFNKDQFLNNLFKTIQLNHKNVTKRLFPSKGDREIGRFNFKNKNKNPNKKRFKNYPKEFKELFFKLYRTMDIDNEGKFVFANGDNLTFWAPTIKNNCKIHGKRCPLYCTKTTFNNIIISQKDKSSHIFFNPNKELEDEERLNLWKRKDLIEEKKKIFLCLSEAEHCTFEPFTNKKKEYLDNNEIVNKRISNKEWVNQMGHNFVSSHPLVYKEGIYKKARISFLKGNYSETMKRISLAFDIDAIKAFFDPKFDIIYKKKLEIEKKNVNKNEMTSLFDQDNNSKKKNVQQDDFKNGKNKELCFQVFSMVTIIEDYKKGREKDTKKIEEELKIIKKFKNDNSLIMNDTQKLEGNSLNNNNDNNNNNTLKGNISTNMNTTISKDKENYLKDRYFKFFKSIMCPLK
jgi:hypothetical protein